MITATLLRPSSGPAQAVQVVLCLGLTLGLPLGLVGCAEPIGPPDVTLFQTADCTADGNLGLGGLRPAVPVDSMQLRQRVAGGTLKTLSTSGTECVQATNPQQCMTALDALPSAPGFHPCATSDCGHVLTTTTGDVVKSYPDAKSVIGFLGTIDTGMDAMFFVYAQGYEVSCTDTSVGGVRPALDGNGYEVLASLPTPSCNPTKITGYQFHVTSGGSLTYYSSWPIAPVAGALPCPP